VTYDLPFYALLAFPAMDSRWAARFRRPDRLARLTLDLLKTLGRVGKKGAAFKSLADAWSTRQRRTRA
jgi:hypothetical protein